MFVGLGSASHYLMEWFHPVAAFDSDSDAREVFTKFFPEAVVTTDFNNMLVEGDGDGTYKQAAKTARAAFCNPPCSSISVVNDARDESSAQARLVVDTVRLLQDGVLEVMIIESTPNLVAALGGKLYAEMQAVAASLPTPYIPHLFMIDPPRIGGWTCRTRAIVALVREDVYQAKGPFVPPKSYEKHGTAGTIKQIMDPPTAESMSSRHSLTSDGDWKCTHFKHLPGYTGPCLEFTWDDGGRIRRAYHIDGCCPTITSDGVYIFDTTGTTDCIRLMTANELGRCHGLPREVVESLPAHKATGLIGRGTERLTIQAVGGYLSDYIGPVAPAHVQPAPMSASCVYASSTFQGMDLSPYPFDHPLRNGEAIDRARADTWGQNVDRSTWKRNGTEVKVRQTDGR
jgi:hypothetical protein